MGSTLFGGFFDTDGFMPHGTCLLWKPSVFWLNAISDGIITIAYYSIPFALAYFVRRRRDLAFPWIFELFGLFILACGTTHAMEIWTLWHPDYAVAGLVKAATATASIFTALLLWPLMPRALALPSPSLLADMNQKLERQIAERRQAEETVRELNLDLEQRVHDRTLALEAANRQLAAEVEERRRAEERLVQVQKLEAIGQLTGGLAHDFNNIMAVVIGNLDLLEQRLAGDPVAAGHAQRAMAASLSGADLTRKLLAFARKQPLQAVSLDLNKAVNELAPLLTRTLGEKISVQIQSAGQLWHTEADRAQVQSAIVNLAINARDAMPDGGHLTIETANKHLDERYCAENPSVAPGDYVMLAVTDTGVGIAPENLDRVLEPFFTTKEVGKGSGLGLSMIYGFAKQSRGHLKIYSEPGHGTSVRVYLPRSSQDAARQPAPEAAETLDLNGRNEVILVVEDNDGVRKAVLAQLAELGYRTLEAENGASAVRVLQSVGNVDLLFTDIVMPGGMTGIDLGEKASQLQPGIKVLYTSGYTEMSILSGRAGVPLAHLLAKPYRKRELATKLRQIFDQPI